MYVCSLCDKISTLAYHLINHYATVHEHCICGLCDKNVTHGDNLGNHIIIIHLSQVWLNFQRSQDQTNNNQEGANSRINRALKQTHPSPMVLLCFVYQELRTAETQAATAAVGHPR